MKNTNDLIAQLAIEARPVRRLSHPLWRAALWLLLSATVLGLIAMEHGLRPDLWTQWQSAAFRTRLCASLATAVLAAAGCLLASLPDRSRLWLLLPAPALAIWLSGIGYGCLTDWVSVDSARMEWGETARCFATLMVVSLPLSGATFGMLRHAARLRPDAIILGAGLAVGAMAATAMSLLHQIDATLMVLMWNLGGAALIVAGGTLFGRRLLGWFNRILA